MPISATPSQASFLSFGAVSCTTNCGVFSSSGGSAAGNFTLGITSGIIYNQLIVSADTLSTNNTYTLTAGSGGLCSSGASGATLQLSGNTLSLWGAVSSLGAVTNLSTGCNLIASFVGTGAWQVNSAGSGSAETGTVSIFGTNLASVTENNTLLGDLGLVANTSASALIGGSLSGKSSTGNGTFNSTISPTAAFSLAQTATPEPFSFGLMGFGLIAAVYLARRRPGTVLSRD